jgi:hypothetical protein
MTNNFTYRFFHWQLFGLLCLAVLLITGCSKDTDIFVPDPIQPVPDTNWVPAITESMPVVLLKNEIRRNYIVDSVDATAGGEVVTPSGAKFYVQPRTVVDTNGQLVNGKVKLAFLHIYKNGDLIRMNKPTYHLGRMFASGGVTYAQLTKGEQELKLAGDHTAMIEMPANAALMDSLRLHFGNGSNFLEYSWQLNYDSINRIVNGSNTYLMHTRRLGWIGSGRAYNTFAPVTLQVQLPPRFTNANSFVSVVLNNNLCMASCHGQLAPKRFVAYGLPGGFPAKLIVLSKLGNQYFAATKSINIQTGISGAVVVQQESMTPVLSSLGAINELLDNL